MVSFQSISIVPPANSSPEVQAEARKRAESALKDAKAADTYEKFGLLAEKISDDDFRVNMGFRKPFDISKLPPSIADKLKSMKAGEVSGIIAIDGGFTILRLIQLDPPETRKFTVVSGELKKNLQRQKQEELRASLNERLRTKSKVEEL
jgi:parvulin-like peptidyl-prolyl isomerase